MAVNARPACANCSRPCGRGPYCARCRRAAEVRGEFHQFVDGLDREEDPGYSARARRYLDEWSTWGWMHADLDRFGPLWHSLAVVGQSVTERARKRREGPKRVVRPPQGTTQARKLLARVLDDSECPTMQFAAVVGYYQMGLGIKAIARRWGKHRKSVQQAISGACRRFGIGVVS